MASNRACVFLCLIFLTSTSSIASPNEEPNCYSRFDFESRLLERMLKVEFENSLLRDKTAEAFAELEKVSKKLKEEQASKLDEVTALGNDLRKDVDDMTRSFEETRKNLVDDFANLYKDFEDNAEAKWKEIEVQAMKPAVAFLAKTLSTTSPARNEILTFTETVTNTDDVYDVTTGQFTAPVNGTYWFSVQMCPNSGPYLHIQIFADDKEIASSYMYDGIGYNPCSTTAAVAVLSVGNKVDVKLGPGSSSSGRIIEQGPYRWASFSGALVH